MDDDDDDDDDGGGDDDDDDILFIDFKFGILNLKIFVIIMILCKHYGVPNVCTHWMYLHAVNIGLKMVL